MMMGFLSEDKAMTNKMKITVIEEASFWKFADWGFNPLPDWVPDGIIYENERGHKMARGKYEYEALAVPVAHIARTPEETLAMFEQRKADIRKILESEIARAEAVALTIEDLERQRGNCPRCKGHGGDPEDHQVVAHVPEQAPCRECGGSGRVETP